MTSLARKHHRGRRVVVSPCVVDDTAAATPAIALERVQVKQDPKLSGRMEPYFVDEADAVALWSSPSFSAVLFPTGSVVADVRRSMAGKNLGLVVNPQWVLEGNLISELGLGRQR